MPFSINPFTKRLDFYKTSLTPGGDISTLTGNTGGAVGPDGSGNVDIVGDTDQGITIAGNAGTSTLTASFSDSTDQDFAFLATLNVGAVAPTFSYNINVEDNVASPLGISLNNKDTSSAAEVDLVMESHGTGDIQTNLLYSAGQSFSYGMDASDSKAFKISRSSVLGTNDCIRIDQSSGAIKFDNAYTFPTADGSSNQYLGTNGSGSLSFSSISGFAPSTAGYLNLFSQASNYTVTNLAYGFYDMEPTTSGLKFILPVMNASNSPQTTSFGIVVRNTGQYPFVVYYTGGSIASRTIYPGQIAWLRPLSNATSTGAWKTLILTDSFYATITTDNTTTPMITLPLAASEAVRLNGSFSCVKDDYSVMQSGSFECSARRGVAGDIVLCSSPIINYDWGTAPTISIVGDTGTESLIVNVIGETATNYNWEMQVEINNYRSYG